MQISQINLFSYVYKSTLFFAEHCDHVWRYNTVECQQSTPLKHFFYRSFLHVSAGWHEHRCLIICFTTVLYAIGIGIGML
jgi:hypothetical protein